MTGRYDGNQDHVYSNQAFTHTLNEFGIPHEAEEYNGVWGTGNWGVDGRVYTEVLPILLGIWFSTRVWHRMRHIELGGSIPSLWKTLSPRNE